jgi:hypothetical protein
MATELKELANKVEELMVIVGKEEAIDTVITDHIKRLEVPNEMKAFCYLKAQVEREMQK